MSEMITGWAQVAHHVGQRPHFFVSLTHWSAGAGPSAAQEALSRMESARRVAQGCLAALGRGAPKFPVRTPEQIEIDTLRARLAALEETVATLQRRVEEPLHEDPAHVWVREHPEAVASHSGKHVAIHPARGVVASSASLEEVIAEVQRMGMLDAVEFDYFPEA